MPAFIMKGVSMTKEQIVNGIATYIEDEAIPLITDKATKIVASVAVKAVKANNALLDSFFDNPMVKTLLKEENGEYDLTDLIKYIEESIKQYGPFPVEIPAIPLVSPKNITFTFDDKDVLSIRRAIERG